MKKIYISFILLISIWILFLCLYEEALEATYIWALASASFLIFPMIYVLSKKTVNEKTVKKLSFWNSVAVICISIYGNAERYAKSSMESIITEILFFIVWGIVYYFINYCLYSKDTKEKEYVFVCANCGSKVKESAKKCPECGELFEEEVGKKQEIKSNKKKDSTSRTNIDQKYSDLNKLKKLLDKNIITKEEFEKEKKKILKN